MKQKTKKPKTNTSSTPEPMVFIGLRVPAEWIEATKDHCKDAGFPGSHPTILRRAMQIGLKTMGIDTER